MQTILSRPDGSVVGINRAALNFIPTTLLTNAPDTIVTVPAGGTTAPIAMTVNGEGPAQVVKFGRQYDQAVKVFLRMQEGSIFRPLMNGFVHIDTIFGQGRTPYPLPEPLYVDELRRLWIEMMSLSTTDASVRVAAGSLKATSMEADPTLELSRKRQDFKQFLSYPFWYAPDDGLITLTGTTVVEKTITVGAENHFMLHQLMRVCDAAFDINIIDMATGESMVQAPLGTNYLVADDILFGDANYPYCLQSPKLFQTGQKILLRLANRVAGTNNVYITLGGQAIADKLWR